MTGGRHVGVTPVSPRTVATTGAGDRVANAVLKVEQKA
jgi:hypothetical protein